MTNAIGVAQEEIIAAFKSASADVPGLATKLGTSIAYLSVTATKVVTQHGVDAVKITIALNSGDPVEVLSEVAGVAAGLITTPAAGLALEMLASAYLTPAAGIPIGAIGGIAFGAVASEGTKVSVKNYLNSNLVGEWDNASVGAIDMSMKLRTDAPSSVTPTDLPPANLAPSSALVIDPIDQQAKVIFNSSASRVYDPDVASGPNTYIVQPGDSLWKIAQTNGWDWNELKAANPQLTDPNFIRPGQLINGLPPVSVTDAISITNPYVNAETSTWSPTDLTDVSDYEGGQIAPGVAFVDPSVVNGSVSRFDAEAGAITGDYWMPADQAITPTAQQDAQVEQWGDNYDVVSSVASFDPVPADTAAATVSNALNLSFFGIDPLVLDLNDDGVRLTSYQDKTVLFDVDHDGGSKEQTGWVAANTITSGTPPAINTDGIVVHDWNSNGIIDNIAETLSEYYNGTVGTGGDAGTKPFTDGFDALAYLDTGSGGLGTPGYHDTVFNSLDDAWNNVRVWVDDNADGVSFKDVNGNGTYQAGIDITELKTFAELGITSINLSPTTQSGLVNSGNEILATGDFVIDGQTREAQAANFLARAEKRGHSTFSGFFVGGRGGARWIQGRTGGPVALAT